MKEYVIYLEKTQTSILRVVAKNKKEAYETTERLIDDIYDENIDINKIISWNPRYKIKIKKKRHARCFFSEE